MIYGWSLSRNVRPGEQIDHPTEGIAFIPPVLHQLSRVFEVKFLHMYMIFYSMLEPLHTGRFDFYIYTDIDTNLLSITPLSMCQISFLFLKKKENKTGGRPFRWWAEKLSFGCREVRGFFRHLTGNSKYWGCSLLWWYKGILDDISHKTIGYVLLLWRYVFFGGMLDVGLLGLFSWGYLGVQDPVIAVNRTSPIHLKRGYIPFIQLGCPSLVPWITKG